MLNRLPRRYPSLVEMLADIGHPTPAKVAKALDVSERTVRRWIERGHAPKPAMFALFWLTSWGQATVHCEAHNTAVLHSQMAAALRRRVAELETQLASLSRIGEFGSANDPLPSVALPETRPATGPRLQKKISSTKRIPGRSSKELRKFLLG